MRRIGPVFLLTALSLLGLPTAPAAGQQLSDKDLAANRELDRQFVEAMNEQDVEKVMHLLWDSPGLILVTPDGTVHLGAKNVRTALQEWLGGMESVHLAIDEVTHVRSGESVLAVGTATYRLQPRDGPPQTFTERWTDVRREIDGRWVYVLDHAHALPPPAP